MLFKRNNFVVIGMVVSMLCTDILAKENGSMPYKNINKILVLIDQHAQSPYTGLIATIESNVEDVSLEDIVLSVVHNNKVIRTVVADKNGSVEFSLLPKEIGDKAIVHINQPKGTVSMSLTAGVKKIDSPLVFYNELFGVLDDLEKVASEMIGLPSWLLPDMDYLEFYFTSSSAITIKGEGINEVYQSTPENIIKIEKNSGFQNANVTLGFSQLPQKVKFLE